MNATHCTPRFLVKGTRLIAGAAFAAALAMTPGAALASPDDSVWYAPPQAPRPQYSPPSAPAKQPATDVRVRARAGSVVINHGRYTSFGPGDARIYVRGGGFYGRYYTPRYDRYHRRYDVPDTATLVELARRYDPAIMGVDPNAEPPTPREQGERALRAGRYALAIALFAEAADEQRRETSEGDQANRQAQRLLGIAYAANRDFENAATQLIDAFEADPSLRTIPLRGEDLFRDGLELNSVTSRAVGHAHRNPSYGSWFTVAVLMQAQGKNDLANQMIQRGEEARDRAREAEASEPENGEAEAPARVTPPRRERQPESEADRLRRELERSTERMLESQRRLDEMKRKQDEAEAKRDDAN